MYKNVFSAKLNGRELSQKLTAVARFLQILGLVLAILSFLFFLILGIVNVANSSPTYYANGYGDYAYTPATGSVGLGIFLIFFSFFAAAFSLVFYGVLALLVKSFASVVLHTYITALDSDKIADNTTPKAQ